jgi:rRNA-processing protein FCF1
VVILYLETNFLMSLALNQDSEASTLLEKAAQDKSLKLAIPQVCIMEAVSTIRRRVEERSSFQRRIRTEINQLERSKTSPVARQLLEELNQSSITNDVFTNRILDDFQQATDRLASIGEMFPVGRDSLKRSLANPLIKSKRERLVLPDNLIICNIIENALVHPSEIKAFLSGNHKDFGAEVVQKALKAAGIEKYFAEAKNFLGWYGSMPN